MIIWGLQRSGVNVDQFQESQSPPPYICLRYPDGRIRALVIVWIDNILMLTSDAELCTDFFDNMLLIKSPQHFNVQWKEWKKYGPANFSASGKKEKPTFLGIEFLISKRRRDDTLSLMWRHEEIRTKEWHTLIPDLTTDSQFVTPRRFAKAIGVIVWHQYLSCRMMLCIEPTIEILREVARRARLSGWDTPVQWSEAELETVREGVLRVLANSPMSLPAEVPPVQTVLAASDSSDNAYGFIVFSNKECTEVHTVVSKKWNTRIRRGHIYTKEFLAATLCIEKICKDCSVPTKIRLGVDNTAVVGAIQRMYSSTKVGKEMLLRIRKVVHDKGHSLEVIHILGEDNPADEPSRLKPLSLEKMANFGRLLVLATDGLHHLRRSSRRPNRTPEMGKVVHKEEDEDEPFLEYLNEISHASGNGENGTSPEGAVS